MCYLSRDHINVSYIVYVPREKKINIVSLCENKVTVGWSNAVVLASHPI